MAIGRAGANATNISNTLEGICVNTIVLTSPILSAILAATINENAVRAPAIEKIYDRVVRSAPNLVKNQKDTILWITKPPANESTAKSADTLGTIFLDCMDRG